MWFFDKKSKKKTNEIKKSQTEDNLKEEIVVADEYELEQSVNEVEENQTKEFKSETISTKDLSTEDILAHLDEGDTQEFSPNSDGHEEVEFDITKTIQDEKKLINLIEGLSSDVEGDEDFIVTEDPVVVDPFEKYESRVKKIISESKK